MTTYQRAVASNIWKHGIHLATNKRSYLSILGVYLLTVPEATAQTIGLMALIGNAAGFLFEVPSGYLADKMGHRRAMIFSRFCLFLSSTFYLIGTHVPFFLVAAVFLNIGQAFQSGTSTAFMHETLKEIGREHDFSKIMGRLSSLGFAIPIPLIVLIPFLVPISFKLPFLIAVIIDLVGLMATYTYVEPRRSHVDIEEISNTNFTDVIREGYRLGYFKYALINAVMGGVITAVAIYKDAYQAFLGVPIIWYGLFWGISRALISSALLMNGAITRHVSFHTFIFLRIIAAIAIVLGLGMSANPFVIVVLFIFISTFNWCITAANQQYILKIIGASKFKATLLSLRQLVTFLIVAGTSYITGSLIVAQNYDHAFIVIGTVLSFILASLYGYIIYASRKITY